MAQLFERLVLILLVSMLLPQPGQAQQRVFNVAVIGDGPADRLELRREEYVEELLTLTSNEFEVRVKELDGSWSDESIRGVFEAAYADPDIDYLLVTGFVANQIGAQLGEYPKPTFLPVLLDAGLLHKPPVDLTSGIPNLNYLTVYSDFGEDLDALADVAPFDHLALILDRELSAAIPALRQVSAAICAERGIVLSEVLHDGSSHELMTRIPYGVNAVFIAGLPRMPAEKFDQFIEQINAAGIPSYSFVGVSDVERGLLMTGSESRDVSRQARLNALNMQAVMLGALPEDQPISASATKRYTINMATARRLGISPRFDILNESTLLNETPTATGQLFGVVEVAVEAMNQNQDLLSQRFATDAGFEDIDIAQSSLWPQVGVGASYNTRRVTPLVELGLNPEYTADGAATLDQLIYSDPVYANIEIQKQIQLGREALLSQVRLDIVQASTSAYYAVLNAQEQLVVEENNLDVTQRNLELAKDRVDLGSSSAADVYRWEAEQARARIRVVSARANLNQSWNRLNRLLHRPQFERLALKSATLNEPFVISEKEFDELIRSPADYSRFSNFMINRGLSQSPELTQIDSQIAAKRRDVTSQKRSFWVPDVSVAGTYSSNFARSSVEGTGFPNVSGLEDWNIGVQATLPIFTGGRRSSSLTRSELELRQLEVTRISESEKVEEEIRLQLHAAQAAYRTIELSRQAAVASKRNFDLVADAYARGTVSIIQLLDAQDASLSANAASISSVYEFLITIMALQRSVGGFDYLLTEAERLDFAQQLRAYMTRNVE